MPEGRRFFECQDGVKKLCRPRGRMFGPRPCGEDLLVQAFIAEPAAEAFRAPFCLGLPARCQATPVRSSVGQCTA